MPKKPVFGKCRLCQQEKRLVDSHIIPDFHFKPLKKKDGYFLRLSTNPQRKQAKRQKGLTENLFCATCDNERLQKNEAHLARVIFGGQPLEGKNIGPVCYLRGYDYKRVKNGLLSILWRMSISSNPMFATVALGNKHEEAIRIALLSDAEFAEDDYPIMVTAPLIEGQFLPDLIVQPDCARVGANHAYRCVISGLVFTFFVGSSPIDVSIRDFILRKEVLPLVISPIEQIGFLYDTFLRFARAQASRNA